MKVLLITHNPVCTQNNMGKTFLSLFSQFEKQELCQLYIYPSYPDVDFCSAYYRMTDKEALKSFFLRQKIGAPVPEEKICVEQGRFERASDEGLYRNRKNKRPLRRLLRDTVWLGANWRHRELDAWLEAQAPTCIFTAPGAGKFLHNFALYISQKLQIPIVTYVCDEYYFVKEPADPLDRWRLRLLKEKVDTLMAKTAHLVVICRELQQEYSSHFGVPATVLMTGAAPQTVRTQQVENPTVISYFGNIRCNRFVSLGQVAKCLDDINRERGTDYTLKIYSAEKDPQILDDLARYQSVRLCGFVSGEAFDQAMEQSHLLLHVEAFDEDSIDFVKHSVSTKIADSLASGIPLLAYGPENIASMQHLLRNDCALTATEETQLRAMLERALTDGNARNQAVENALKVAADYHDSEKNSRRLRECLRQISDAGV